MMDHRKALTISLTVDKDNSTIGNPLRIPMTCFSSGYGKLERQIHWTKFTGSKARYNDSKHKNGSMQFDHHEAALVRLGMASRKPCLILTDVLKTEPGRAYLDGKRRDQTSGNGRRLSSLRSENSRRREEPLVCGERRSGLREAKHKVLPNTNKSATPKRNQGTLSLSSERLRLRSRSEDAEQEDVKEEDKEVMEVIIGEDNGENDKNAEVVDCGLSLSWKPTANTGGDELSPASTKNDCPEPESDEQCSVKRKRENAESHCNGTGTPTGHRGSVLRLSGGDRGPAAKRLCPEERGEDSEVDHGILQLTVGGDDRTERGLSPVVSPRSEAPETRGVPRQSLSTSQDNTTQATPSEPIVLSSDDEEGSGIPRPCGPVFHTLVSVGETATQGQPSQEVEAEQQDVSHMQLVHVVVEDFPGTEASSFGPPPVHRADGSSMSMAFSVLHCGGFQGEANGALMITHQRVIIPLKDASGQVEVTLTLEPRELRRYSVWEQQELQALGLGYRGKEQPSPAALLLFYVSDTQAAAIQRDLCKLSLRQLGPTPMGPASPFVLLSLRDALEGVEGAVVYSILDIICLNNLTHQKSSVAPSLDSISMLEDIHSPALSLDQTLELIRITGLDPQLLSLLGVDSTDPESNTDQDGPQSDGENKNEPHSQLEFESQIESVPQLDTEPEQDTEPQLKPEEEKEKEPPAEEKSEEPAPIYTLCHRRTRGSYSVFLAKPDSSWTKYTHQGLARRLIQFPPPPLKGGITVTMEDLQCLDSGQFLNDVIIDFYLKYLLQNASAAVAERSHIFSSFFYKQLTRRDNASESGTSDSCQRQRRHQRVKTWTRHVDIFKKDFLFVPVNQEAHWYLVVICFPGLDEPQFEPWTGPGLQKENRTGEAQAREEAQRCRSSHVVSEASPASNSSDNMDKLTENAQEDSTKESPPGPPNCTEQTCQREVICKRPCILIMDSLKLSLHERVFKLLREYLQSEWEVRRGSVKDFSTEQMKNSHCRVPLQDNSSDCGLYLLQYVESFLKDPVVHFDLPLRLERWFPRQQVRRKRDEIRDLILNLYRYQNQENVVR